MGPGSFHTDASAGLLVDVVRSMCGGAELSTWPAMSQLNFSLSPGFRSSLEDVTDLPRFICGLKYPPGIRLLSEPPAAFTEVLTL